VHGVRAGQVRFQLRPGVRNIPILRATFRVFCSCKRAAGGLGRCGSYRMKTKSGRAAFLKKLLTWIITAREQPQKSKKRVSEAPFAYRTRGPPNGSGGGGLRSRRGSCA
jgi:hypothetical protein